MSITSPIEGEYIAPEKIENTYSHCSLVAQIFVYGESLKSTLVAILVPDQVVLEIWSRNNNINQDFKELCRNKVCFNLNIAKLLLYFFSSQEVKKAILRELHSLGQRDGLKSFEQVKGIYIHEDLFTIENGLLTPTLKSKVRAFNMHNLLQCNH